jgi:hypothetical protein
MKSLQSFLSDHYDRQFDVARELPELCVTDASVLDHLDCGGGMYLLLIEDEDGSRAIVRDDIGGIRSYAYDDMEAIAAQAVDCDFSLLRDWFDNDFYNNCIAHATDMGWLQSEED